MKIGTILFVYHRSEHTRKVISALSESDILPQKLYIFQDGIKESTNYSEWKKVNELIESVNWCDKEVHISEKNKGLAKSIVTGVNYVLQQCDAVIVLEDDCVVHKQFMRFMTSALNMYKEEKKVYSVSGYAWDIDLPNQEEDAYFNGKFCSWGWGTWRDRWCQYEENYHILTGIKNDSESNQRFNIWGRNMEPMLVGTVTGKYEAWDAMWGLKIIEKGGYCLNPYKQLVHNIGFDGTGVHCAERQEQRKMLSEGYKGSFCFPKKIECTEICEEEFRFLFGGIQGTEKMALYQDVLVRWIKMKQQGQKIRLMDEWENGTAVWGKGIILDCLLNELIHQVSIRYIIESRPSIKEYKGIPIISIYQLPDDIKNIIVIPYFDLKIMETKVHRMRPDIKLYGINELIG